MPSSWYSSSRSATSLWLPTSAVPAPPRTRPTPDQRLGGSRGRAPRRSRAPAVQVAHPLLADRLALTRASWALLDRRRVEAVEQPSAPAAMPARLVSREMVWIRRPNRTSRPCCLGQPADPGDLLGHLLRRLAPGEVDVGVPCGHRPGRCRGSAEVDLRQRVDRAADLGALDLVVLAVEVERRLGPRAAHDDEELVGAGVALRVAEVVAEAPLLRRLAPGDDVEQQPPGGDPLEGRRHLGRQRRGGDSRAGRRPGTSGGSSPGTAPR